MQNKGNRHQIKLWAVFQYPTDVNPVAYFMDEDRAVETIAYNYPYGLLVPFKATIKQWGTLMQKGRVHWADLVARERAGVQNPTVVSGSASQPTTSLTLV